MYLNKIVVCSCIISSLFSLPNTSINNINVDNSNRNEPVLQIEPLIIECNDSTNTDTIKESDVIIISEDCEIKDDIEDIEEISENILEESEEIVEEELQFTEYDIPENNGFKSYMPYTAITSRSSKQYKLQDGYAYTGNYGIREVDDRYCVAIGTAFNAGIGTYIDLVLNNGTIIPCIVGDVKDPAHTKTDNITTKANGCVSEFIVDKKNLDKTAKRMGDVSYCQEDWKSKVDIIRIYEKNAFN